MTWDRDRQRQRMRQQGTADVKKHPPAFAPMLPLQHNKRRPRQSRDQTRDILAGALANTEADELDKLLAAARRPNE